MLTNIEPHQEHSQFVKLMSFQVDSVTRQMPKWHGFFLNASKPVTNYLNQKLLMAVPVVRKQIQQPG